MANVNTDIGQRCLTPATATTSSRRMYAGLWWGKLKGRKHLENVGIDGRIY